MISSLIARQEDSKVYDYGLTCALAGFDFDGRAEQLALGATCSLRFTERYEALERGFAEGLRIVAVNRQLRRAQSDALKKAPSFPTHLERRADAGYDLSDPKGYGL